LGVCKGCGEKFDLVDSDFSCPICKGKNWNMMSGRELIIKELGVI
jgi:hydrogenase nickel incorporation protein HypA/HybF